MKILLSFLLLLHMIFLFSNCGSPCGVPSGRPDSYDSASIATLKLNDSSKYWLESLQQNQFFTNKAGITNNLQISGLQEYTARIESTYEGLIDRDGCEVENGHLIKFFTYPFQQFTLIDKNGTRLEIIRGKFIEDYEKVKQRPNELNKISDALYIMIDKYYQFDIIPRSKRALARYMMHDTITLGNKQLSNVLFAYQDTIGGSEYYKPTMPYGVYYKVDQGLVGYAFMNGEFWFQNSIYYSFRI
jgi:hypothetical protein